MQDAFSDFKAWYFTKPLFTRTYLTACVILTLAFTFKLFSIYSILYSFRATFFEFQIWRLVTGLLFMGKFDFGFIFNMYFAFVALSKVQTQVFSRERYADFLWLTIMLYLGCVICASIFSLMLFGEVFLMGLIYIWCKRMPHEQIRILFGMVVKTGYFPFVYAIMMMLFGGNLLNYIIGIVLGHLYIFVKDIAVVQYHKDYLPTPRWFTNWWFGRQNQPRPGNQAGGVFQGRGVRLE